MKLGRKSEIETQYKGFVWWSRVSMTQRNAVLVFLLAFGAIGGYFLLFGSSAAPQPPTVYLTPATQTMGANATFTVQVRENSSTTAVNAVQANLSYPTNLLSFVSIDSTGSAFGIEAESTGGSGQVHIARGLTGSVTGDQLVATITFKSLTTDGSASVPFTTGTSLVAASSNANILGSLAATGGGTYVVDLTPPTVGITSPANGATVAGGSAVPVTITASDTASSVTGVDVYIDGIKVTTLTASPYTYNWNTNGVSLGSHTIQAKATDSIGNLGSSALTTVTVADTTPPTVAITAPIANATLGSIVTVTAGATDNVGGTGIAKVEFYVDGALKSTDTVAPYSFSWDSRTATDGIHALTAKAYDNATSANVTTATAVSVRVDNTAPTTPGNVRATGTTLNSITLAWNASTDANGVTGYRVQRDGVTIATTAGTTLSYADNSLPAGTSYTYTVSALDGVGNASPVATLTAATLTPKSGDLNGDNQVNITDLSILLSHWNTADATSDINHDGTVSIFDLSVLLSRWGT